MQELRVIGVEEASLIVASAEGTRYSIPVEDVLQARLRIPQQDIGSDRKIAPKDIQAHIRSGMSAQDVAAITGAPLDYIQRFEGPVVAEREFVVQSALDVPVRTAADNDPLAEPTTFGIVIRQRLAALGGSGERWASWKEAGSGWVVKLSFIADQIERDARWQFDPRKQSLVPLNTEAVTLSQQGDSASGLVPRLRAVAPGETTSEGDRFDSGAFLVESSAPEAVSPSPEPVPIARARMDEAVHGNQTADLLEALRRRRGERESAPMVEGDVADDGGRSQHPSTGSVRVIDVPLSPMEDDSSMRSTAPQPTARKKGRASMPSWDEIVFGARPDEDPA
ncbi:hypothetical protein M2152_001219 [Microbacteriaceae bacterium SG_E_30_P1]|uniref:DUF3071 domain-containing protein n=1 Tax=Antiquaquibacter oligotrophicus TaxID=2880260 RepID=A0ABT6KPG4_9MICO|nr:septation protein SepH [Antiquaquibacter oligotrophicus]MDH6181037.1 hypothetical protein [Antiquaquibacter oligotrophicus]UDF13265.1 DUF3071 domain-containing protein [Antiquaquibacter oligotrophicus]